MLDAQSAHSAQGSYSVQVASLLLTREVQYIKTITYKNRSSLWRVDSCQSPITLSVQLMTADESEPPVLQVECQLWNVSYDIPPLSCLRLLKGIGDGSQIGLIYVPLKSQL